MSGRIPESFIDDVLSRTDLVELIDSYVHLKRTGKNYSACCPFHQEKTPSFTVSPDKQFYYCFGCGASGNAVGFLMEYTRLSFIEALETLCRTLGLEIPRDDNFKPRQDYQPLYNVLEAATAFYEQQLRNPQTKDRPVNYLKSRGLSGQTAKQFRVGYAPHGWDNLINQLGKDDTKLNQLMQSGLAVENDKGHRYDRFRDRVIFPIRDSRGRVIAFGGRVLGDDKPKYLNSPETPVFHKGRELYGLYEAKQASNKIRRFVIVEGYMDVIALAQFGIPYAVATLGTATSRDHIEKLFRHSDQLVFCFDGDEAGRKAAWRALENALPCAKDGRQMRVLLLAEGEDPDTLVRKHGKVYFEGLLDEATPLSEYFFAHLSDDLNTSTLDGRARLASLAKPFIEQLPNGVFQQLMLKELRRITQLEELQLAPAEPAPRPAHEPPAAPPALNYDAPPPYTEEYPVSSSSDHNEAYYSDAQNEARPAKPKQRKKLPRPTSDATSRSAHDHPSLVDSTIRLLLNAPRQAATMDLPADLRELTLPRIDILWELFDFIRQQPEASTAAILGHWQNREDGEAVFRLAAKEFLLPNDEQTPELNDAVRRLYLQKVEQDLDQIIADGVKDKSRFKELLHLQKELSN
ncbi:MAG: DNA primase [Ketobacter sp.]|nr:MAG: DNA primase [Ketobacter sp.]